MIVRSGSVGQMRHASGRLKFVLNENKANKEAISKVIKTQNRSNEMNNE